MWRRPSCVADGRGGERGRRRAAPAGTGRVAGQRVRTTGPGGGQEDERLGQLAARDRRTRIGQSAVVGNNVREQQGEPHVTCTRLYMYIFCYYLLLFFVSNAVTSRPNRTRSSFLILSPRRRRTASNGYHNGSSDHQPNTVFRIVIGNVIIFFESIYFFSQKNTDVSEKFILIRWTFTYTFSPKTSWSSSRFVIVGGLVWAFGTLQTASSRNRCCFLYLKEKNEILSCRKPCYKSETCQIRFERTHRLTCYHCQQPQN